MAYTIGDTILDDEYNLFATGNGDGTFNNTNNNVNTVGGPGANDRGYGQSILSAVTAGTTISATQWATLLNTITNYKNHQGSTITAITNPVATDPIAVLSALAGNISTITTNRADAAASGTAITAGGAVSRTSQWNNLVSMPMTVTFASAAHLRYFFNAGGRLTIAFSRSGGTSNSKNTGWTALCTACGTINVTGIGASKTIAAVAYTGTTKIGGSGSTSVLLTGTGAHDYTGALTEVFKQFDSTANYTSNSISVRGKVNTAVITLTVEFQDDSNTDLDEYVDGTLTTTVTAVPPSTTYLSNSWGTPTLGGSESATINPTVVAGVFVTGVTYTIVTAGTTDFTLIGAADSSPGTHFVATGAGSGTGTAVPTAELVRDAIDLNVGITYEVVTVGTSDFTLVGASSNAVGQTFTPTGNLQNAGSFAIGREYVVFSDGTTDYSLIGGSAVPSGGALVAGHTWVGSYFIATGLGSGTGQATETGSIAGTGTAKVV